MIYEVTNPLTQHTQGFRDPDQAEAYRDAVERETECVTVISTIEEPVLPAAVVEPSGIPVEESPDA